MGFGFDLSKVEIENVSGALPAGRYTAEIVKIERKEAKANSANKYLNVQYKVTGMEKRNGAVFFDIVNIFNANEQAQSIGRQRLKSMFLALGYSEEDMNKYDETALIGGVVDCILKVEKNEKGEQNRVSVVLPSESVKNNSVESKSEKLPDWI